MIRAKRILPTAVNGIRNDRPFGNEDSHLNRPERNSVAGLYDRALVPGDCHIVFQASAIGLFNSIPVVVEISKRDQLRQRIEATLMVRVPMADDDVIDLLQARVLRRRVNSFGIAIAVPRKSCIEQQRFSRGRNKQRRCSTFNIDPVDFEITRLRGGRKRKKQNEERKGEFHGLYLHKNRNWSKNIESTFMKT